MTSNRPLEDWGKLLGDVPAATAILDRFLHHAEVIAITGKKLPPAAIGIHNSDRGRCHAIDFRKIRIEMDDNFTRPVFQQRKDQVYKVPSSDRYVPSLVEMVQAKRVCAPGGVPMTRQDGSPSTCRWRTRSIVSTRRRDP